MLVPRPIPLTSLTMLLASAAWVHAGNAVVSATFTLHPTFENMDLEVCCHGDANFNVAGDVFCRAKGQTQRGGGITGRRSSVTRVTRRISRNCWRR